MKRTAKQSAPEICPVCGEDVPRNALACPECGADHLSGWREDALVYDAIDLPDDDFDHDEFVRTELGSRAPRSGRKLLWWAAAIIVLIALLILALSGQW